MSADLLGIHHVTAITGDLHRNIAFYTEVLGLRLVKITVNFDDPESYHLYYGDGRGNPGTIMTFFVWQGARRGIHGSSQVTVTSFAIPRGSSQFWIDRFANNRIDSGKPFEQFGQLTIPFSDPDGLQMSLVEAEASDPPAWLEMPIPPEYAASGFYGATLMESGFELTAKLLQETMGFRLAKQQKNLFRFDIAGGGPSRTVDLMYAPGSTHGRIAAGTVHHIAWRVADDSGQLDWLGRLNPAGYSVSPVMDRIYFHSIYYREPGGILFEIATDPPGFTIDESFESLGGSLKLPPWLEERDRGKTRTMGDRRAERIGFPFSLTRRTGDRPSSISTVGLWTLIPALRSENAPLIQ